MGATRIQGTNNDILAVDLIWIDADADAANLATLFPKAPNGSMAKSIATGHKWVKNSSGVWTASEQG